MTNTPPAITNRRAKNKEVIIENLKRIPIVQVVCEKSGIGRSTYYRWHNEDEEFARLADEALASGRGFINDLAESQLLKAIQNNDLTAIIFWLKHNHRQYGNRLELTAKIKSDNTPLTDEQQALITKALELASLIPQLDVPNEVSHES